MTFRVYKRKSRPVWPEAERSRGVNDDASVPSLWAAFYMLALPTEHGLKR